MSAAQQVLISQQVLMYCTALCPFRLMADRVLAGKGVAEVNRIRIDLESARRDEIMTRTGCYTVPQICIGDFDVGSYDDPSSLNHAGNLDALLRDSSAA